MEVFLQLALNYMDLRKIKGIQTTNFAFTFKARDIEALPVSMASFTHSVIDGLQPSGWRGYNLLQEKNIW